MENGDLVLGLDSSTQSLSAVLIDPVKGSLEYEYAVSYKNDSRLNHFGIDFSSMVIPPREEGEADQPPAMFLASIDALFSDLQFQGIDLKRIKAINVSAQQHGHVYMSHQAPGLFARLGSPETSEYDGANLATLLKDSFSYPGAPIWKTANTASESTWLREKAGGSRAVIQRTGSDSPLRFTGAVIRRMITRNPKAYEATGRILLINSFINAVLTGNLDQPFDFGNGSGTSYLDYSRRDLDPVMIEALAAGAPGGADALKAKLGSVCHPLATVGMVAPWFCRKYGFSDTCRVIAGSGDNPQSKVLFDGDLLSLGTSFVYMVDAGSESRDFTGAANSMYDGLGRPFVFACRTNGALVWDKIRSEHGLAPDDFATAEQALLAKKPGECLRFWQPDAESFPLSGPFGLQGGDSRGRTNFASDYAGLVDSALAIMWHYSKPFASGKSPVLYLTGGPSSSKALVARVAALWNCSVQVIGGAGAALGAAVAGAAALLPDLDRPARVRELCGKLLGGARLVQPDAGLVKAWHGKAADGLSALERLLAAYETIKKG